jgi:hypothetical protein
MASAPIYLIYKVNLRPGTNREMRTIVKANVTMEEAERICNEFNDNRTYRQIATKTRYTYSVKTRK